MPIKPNNTIPTSTRVLVYRLILLTVVSEAMHHTNTTSDFSSCLTTQNTLLKMNLVLII